VAGAAEFSAHCAETIEQKEGMRLIQESRAEVWTRAILRLYRNFLFSLLKEISHVHIRIHETGRNTENLVASVILARLF
jgi:hypothetical protein